MKGTALYIYDVAKVNIASCSFTSNGPVYASLELLYSQWVQGLSGNFTIGFNPETPNCTDEFQYLENCYLTGVTDTILLWSRVQGAVHVWQCQDPTNCISSATFQRVVISSSTFKSNEAGPMLDHLYKNYGDLSATQVFFNGGLNN